jgi:hypothetical protein
VTRSIPLLIFLGLLLYVDRIVRREVILDSSALVATVFVAHLLNVCRSSIAHVDSFSSAYVLSSDIRAMAGQASLAAAVVDHNTTASDPPPFPSWSHNLHHHHHHSPSQLESWPWWQESLVYFAYAAVSILLLMDVDVVSVIVLPTVHNNNTSSPVPTTRKKGGRKKGVNNNSISILQLACWWQTNEPTESSSSSSAMMMQPVPVRISTVVAHCILVGAVLQMGVDRATFMTPARIMVRSFSFTCLSICWTYVAGECWVEKKRIILC